MWLECCAECLPPLYDLDLVHPLRCLTLLSCERNLTHVPVYIVIGQIGTFVEFLWPNSITQRNIKLDEAAHCMLYINTYSAWYIIGVQLVFIEGKT